MGWTSPLFLLRRFLIYQHPFPSVEIDMVVANLEGNNSLRRNDFDFSFFKRLCDLIKGEVSVMFHQLFLKANLPKAFSFHFITMIPKVASSLGIRDL